MGQKNLFKMKRTRDLFHLGTMALGLLILMPSCNNSGSKNQASSDSTATTTTQATTAPTPAPTDSAKSTLNDAQIASIAVTANQIDIDYAKIALKKATNAEVKKFAQTMAKDHQNVIDQAVALAKKLNVTPEDNPTTQSLLAGSKAETPKLEAATKGADFDKAYIDNEVAYHDAVIKAVENTLIPSASNAELKNLLQTALPIFKGHLEHARAIQASLAK